MICKYQDEAAYSNEKGISTHSESKTQSKSTGSGAPGGGDRDMYYSAPDTSTVGIAGGNVFSDDEYDEPDKDHFNQTQKDINILNKKNW